MSLKSNTIQRGEATAPAGVLATSSADSGDEVRGALIRILCEGVDVHRCLAAQALGRMDHPEAVRALVNALLDEDEDVRTDAAGALARLAPPEAGHQLMENLLGDPCSGVKLNAIDALTRLRHRALAPWLRRMLKGRDEEINWDESEFYEGGWDDWVDIQVKAIEALAELGVEEAVPEIVAAIDDEFGQDLSEIGFAALGGLGTPGLAALAVYLDAAEERRRRRAAAVLAASSAAAAQPAVARALADPAREVRLAAARAIAARDPADERLIALFSDPEAQVRAEAVRLCGRYHPECLTGLLVEENPAVTRELLDVIADSPSLMPKQVVIPPLRSLLSGSGAGLAAGAALALAAVASGDALEELTELVLDGTRPEEARLGAARALARLGGGPAAEALAGVLGDDERQLRLESLAGLVTLAAAKEDWPNRPGEILLAALRGELVPAPEAEDDTSEEAGESQEETLTPEGEDEGASEPAFPLSTLQSILGEEAPPVIESEAFGKPVELSQADLDRLALAARVPGKRVVPVTPQVAPYQDVRRFTARVLGDLPRPEVAGALAYALADGDTELRLAAADSLARIGEVIGDFSPTVMEAVIRALTDVEREVRLSAIRALGAAGTPDSVQVLRAGTGDEDSFVRAETLRALAALGAAEPEAEALLDDPDPGVRLAAAEAIAGTGGARAVALLADFAFAFEGRHRRQAGRLLRRLDAAAANARFLEVLEDPDRLRVWPVAIEVLEEINRTDAAARGRAVSQSNQQEGVEA